MSLRIPSGVCLFVLLGSAVGCERAPSPGGVETDAIVVVVDEPRLVDHEVTAGPIHVRLKDGQAGGIRKLYFFVIDDKNGDGEANDGEELVGSEQPYASGCREVTYSLRAQLDSIEGKRLAIAWRVEFGEDGKAAGYKLLKQP